MPKARPVVVLNELQISTLLELQKRANKSNIVSALVVADYKRNVINALIAREALVPHKNGYRLPAVEVVEKPPVVHRKPKETGVAGSQAAVLA